MLLPVGNLLVSSVGAMVNMCSRKSHLKLPVSY